MHQCPRRPTKSRHVTILETVGMFQCSLQKEKFAMVRTRSANHGMNNNVHDDARTSNNPQVTIDLLNTKVAQLERELADRDAALQRREEEAWTTLDEA